jgi:hypothetical protein
MTDKLNGIAHTVKQFNALHVYCEWLADALNAQGLDMRKTLKEGIEIPWSKDMVKEFLVKPILEALTKKKSTTEMSTVEMIEVYEVLNKHLAEKFCIHVPWPKDESKP